MGGKGRDNGWEYNPPKLFLIEARFYLRTKNNLETRAPSR